MTTRTKDVFAGTVEKSFCEGLERKLSNHTVEITDRLNIVAASPTYGLRQMDGVFKLEAEIEVMTDVIAWLWAGHAFEEVLHFATTSLLNFSEGTGERQGSVEILWQAQGKAWATMVRKMRELM